MGARCGKSARRALCGGRPERAVPTATTNSLGTVVNHTAGGDSAKPYQLESATQPSGIRSGQLATLYDDAGNLTRLDVKRNGPCLPTGAQCSQRFDYRWDEVGRLVRARRWDVAAASITTPDAELPGAAAAADLNYTYDAGDQRTIKTAIDSAGAASHTVYLFDTLELRRATFDGTDYERSTDTEVGYLSAHGVRLARLAYEDPDVPTIGTAGLHVFLELGDHLGSTSIVIDKITSELIERGTYQAYGGAESDYRPERWKGFREDYRFTGKEEDVEVGLQYFGKRFLNPLLGRWVSADPLAVHMPGQADLNLYAYVKGGVLKNIDPLGLQESKAAQKFMGEVQTGDYAAATHTMNGLSMTDMLNSLGSLTSEQNDSLRVAVGKAEGVDRARLEYAMNVEATNTLPGSAPSDLRKTGQVSEAANFIAGRLMSVAGSANPEARGMPGSFARNVAG